MRGCPWCFSLFSDKVSTKPYEGQALIIDLVAVPLTCPISTVGQGVFEVIATTGDDAFGSVDYDQAVAEFLRQRLSSLYSVEIEEFTAREERQIRSEAERVKIALGQYDHTIAMIQSRKNATAD